MMASPQLSSTLDQGKVPTVVSQLKTPDGGVSLNHLKL